MEDKEEKEEKQEPQKETGLFVRIPICLKDKIDEHSEKTGIKTKHIVYKALKKFFGRGQ